jgi:hypothetical protein
VTYNGLSDSVNEYVRFSQAEMDPYSELQYAWTFARSNRKADMQLKGAQDASSLETLRAILFTYKNPDFLNYGRTFPAVIPTTKRQLKFTSWMQPKKAPILYIIPGLGAHRLAAPAIALAELAYNQGFSAVCVSSPFDSEFMDNASTAHLPGYLPVDGHDMEVALAAIDRTLRATYPGRIGQRALMGYSMGALESLFIAASAETNRTPLIKFDRVVAIDTPVRLIHGVEKLDEYYSAPLAWPAAERTADLENTLLKVAELTKGSLGPQTQLPFNAIESKFLVGMTFKFILRDVIYDTQRRHNQGVLHHALYKYRRASAYREILKYSFGDYLAKFVAPYYQSCGMHSPMESLQTAGDLRTYDAGLRANPKIRVFVNQDDFLLEAEDLAWLHTTFTPAQLTVFPEGGHLGNLYDPSVQKTIFEALDGMEEVPAKSH